MRCGLFLLGVVHFWVNWNKIDSSITILDKQKTLRTNLKIGI